MSIDEATVARVATLARIKVAAEDRPHLAGDLSKIIDFIEQLNEVDTDGVAPMSSVAAMQLLMREDVVTAGGIADKITANAPEAVGAFFTVPKVVE